MFSRFQMKELWGHLPLFFLIGIWGVIALSLQNKFSKHKNNIARLRLATLSGILLWLGFPLIPLTPLMFIAFVPLLLVEDDISRSREGASKWEVFKYSYHTLFIWNILTTYWVANTAFAAGIFAYVMNTFFMCIPIVLFHQVKKALGGRLMGIGFIAFWITFEYLHMRHDLTWPWLTLGNSFSTFPTWVQWYEYVGVYGGTFWILAANVLFFKLIHNHYPQIIHFFGLEQKAISKQVLNSLLPEGKKGSWATIAALLLLPIVLSLGIYYSYENKGVAKEVVLVQANLEPHHVKFRMNNASTLREHLRFAVEVLDEDTNYLVFPETSFDGVKTNNFYGNSVIRDLKQFIDRYPNLRLITGLGSRKIYEDGEEHGEAVRVFARPGRDTIFWESHNSAIQMSSGPDSTVDLYLKSILVPGAESFPYKNVFWFMEPIVDQLGGSVAGFASQPERSVFKGDGVAVGPVICYESIFGEYCTDYVRKGAGALFIVTNDGWWDNTAGHRQHMAFARLRAIETRRSIARAANLGTCAFINQRGDVTQPTIYDVPGAIKGEVLFNDEITVYTRWGDLIGRVSLFTCILLLLNGLVKGLVKKEP